LLFYYEEQLLLVALAFFQGRTSTATMCSFGIAGGSSVGSRVPRPLACVWKANLAVWITDPYRPFIFIHEADKKMPLSRQSAVNSSTMRWV
jgi:hypothetical protein